MDDFRRLEIMKLISMTDFVIKVEEDANFYCETQYNKIVKYARFLKQSLTLGMFVPCDDQGNVLKEPEGWRSGECDIKDCDYPCKCEQYKKEKGKVLFKGFELFEDSKGKYLKSSYDAFEIGYLDRAPNVEYAAIGYELTESAIKQIGL